MSHEDFYYYWFNNRIIDKKEIDYAIEMISCNHWWEKIIVYIKYKFNLIKDK